MKINMKKSAAVTRAISAVLSVMCYSPIQAQEISIKSGNSDFGLNGRVETLHIYDEIQITKSTRKRSPLVRVSPVLGARVLGGQVSLSLKGSFDRLTETTAFKQKEQAELKATLSPLMYGDLLKITPTIKHKFAGAGKDSSIKLYSVQVLSSAFVGQMGTMIPELSLEAGTQVHGRDQKTNYSVDDSVSSSSYDGLGLTRVANNENKFLGKKTAQSFYHQWAIGIRILPTYLKNFSVDVGTLVEFVHDPEYKVKSTKQVEKTYQVKPSSVEHIGLAYKINEQVSLKNDFYRFQDGFFATGSKPGAKLISNELQLSYTLF